MLYLYFYIVDEPGTAFRVPSALRYQTVGEEGEKKKYKKTNGPTTFSPFTDSKTKELVISM